MPSNLVLDLDLIHFTLLCDGFCLISFKRFGLSRGIQLLVVDLILWGQLLSMMRVGSKKYSTANLSQLLKWYPYVNYSQGSINLNVFLLLTFFSTQGFFRLIHSILMEFHPFHLQMDNEINIPGDLSVALSLSSWLLSSILPSTAEPSSPPLTLISGSSSYWDCLAFFGFSFPGWQPGHCLQKITYFNHHVGLFVSFLSGMTVLCWLLSNVWNLLLHMYVCMYRYIQGHSHGSVLLAEVEMPLKLQKRNNFPIPFHWKGAEIMI